MHRIKIWALLPAVVFLSSCISTFSVVDREPVAKGKKLAVISGLNKPENLMYAAFLTQSLKKYTMFQVMPQEEVKARVPAYPFRIRGPYLSYIGLDADYSRTNIKKIQEIQKKLGADYLYVIWAPSSYTVNNGVIVLCTVGQMFSFPGGKEIGRGDYSLSWAKPGAFVIGPKKSPEETMLYFSELSAKEIAEKLNMTKPGPAGKN